MFFDVSKAYLLNWQNRFYLFENRQTLDDQHIQRYFLPYARTFGQGNQMNRVEFDYQNRRWRMVDIGRSQVNFTEGEGLHVQRGAEARFIYAQSGKTPASGRFPFRRSRARYPLAGGSGEGV